MQDFIDFIKAIAMVLLIGGVIAAIPFIGLAITMVAMVVGVFVLLVQYFKSTHL